MPHLQCLLSEQWYIKGMSRLHINTFAVQLLSLPCDSSSSFSSLSSLEGDNGDYQQQNPSSLFSKALQDAAIASLGAGAGNESHRSHHRPRSAGGSAVYHVGSMFNHSCAPNVHATWPSGTSSASFRALRDIHLGEELVISYIDTDMSYERRQASLLLNYGFRCECPKCQDDDDDRDKK